MTKKNIIEINGKRYDSRTGELVAEHGPHPALPKPHHVAAKAAPDLLKKPWRHTPSKHAARHQPENSKTLMRHAVKKPDSKLKRHLKVQGHTDTSAVKPVASVNRIKKLDDKRLVKAKQINKSHLIKHFSPSGVSSYTASVATSPHPKPAATPHLAPPVSQQPSPQTATDRLLERALAQATSHQQPPVKIKRRIKKHHAGIGVTLVVAVSVLLTGQNFGANQLQTASAQAGFSVDLPEYVPTGFKQAEVATAPDMIAVRFQSRGDSRSYTITQKASEWSSAGLRSNFVAATDSRYQVANTSGRTVYLYGKQNATWVDDGIWYVVQAEGALTDRQLIELAASS